NDLKNIYPNLWKLAKGMNQWNGGSFFRKVRDLCNSYERKDPLQLTLTQNWFKTICSDVETSMKNPQKRKKSDIGDDTTEVIPSKRIRLAKDEKNLLGKKAEEKPIEDFTNNKLDEILHLLQNIDKRIDDLSKRITKIENQLEEKNK
ncbi:hypothetical protein RFI_32405, partial [Reticulomyxa filosa]